MAGYTRQDTNDNIATGKVINASDFDNEYNAIQSAFDASSGHKHDGTAAEGARITVIGSSGKFSTDANAFFPTNTATVGLGKTSFVFKDLHIDNIVADGNTISTITSGNLILDPYTYKLEVKGGSTGGATSGMIQLNCENNSHGQTIQSQPHSAGVTNKMLLPAGADSTLVSLVSADTLTNKTLTTPVVNAGLQLKNGATSAGFLEFFEDSDNGTNKATLIGPASTADVTLTLPSATDTLVGKATSDTLTNKTIDANGTGNSITNLEVADLASGVLDTDLASVSGSDDTLASAKALKLT